MGKLADQIRDLRRAKGLSVRELGRLLGRSAGYISRIETTDEIPSASFTIELADALNVGAEELLELARTDFVQHVDEEVGQRQKEALRLFRKGK